MNNYKKLCEDLIRCAIEHDYDYELEQNIAFAINAIKNLQAENEKLNREFTVMTEFAGKLVALCNPPEEEKHKLFKRYKKRAGDYLGCGYTFLDDFNRIFDEFENTTDDEVFRVVMSIVEKALKERE